ncbi:hypothetical protein Droror1_Dr00024329 [Drosera rotundifolia]
MKIPKSGSWGWRKLLQLRATAQPHISWRVGNGQSISFWFDSWSEHGPLNLKVSNSFIYNTCIARNTKLALFINGTTWQFPPAIQNLFQGITLPRIYQGNDICCWGKGNIQRFGSANAWQTLRPRKPMVPWYISVWYKGYIPRHSFILWLAAQERLNTMVRLIGVGLMEHSMCVFCTKEIETKTTSFFLVSC